MILRDAATYVAEPKYTRNIGCSDGPDVHAPRIPIIAARNANADRNDLCFENYGIT